MSADLISETLKKKPITSPHSSFAEDIIKHLKIVTPSGRVDATDHSCYISHLIVYILSVHTT